MMYVFHELKMMYDVDVWKAKIWCMSLMLMFVSEKLDVWCFILSVMLHHFCHMMILYTWSLYLDQPIKLCNSPIKLRNFKFLNLEKTIKLWENILTTRASTFTAPCGRLITWWANCTIWRVSSSGKRFSSLPVTMALVLAGPLLAQVTLKKKTLVEEVGRHVVEFSTMELARCGIIKG